MTDFGAEPSSSPQFSAGKEKRPWYKKKRWIIPGVILLLIIVVSVATSLGSKDNNSGSSGNGSTSTTVNKATVTLDEYDKVQTGMTYQQVVDIFGGKEQSANSTEIGGQKMDTVTWNGDGFGDTVIIQFDGGKESGKVVSKSQSGLGK